VPTWHGLGYASGEDDGFTTPEEPSRCLVHASLYAGVGPADARRLVGCFLGKRSLFHKRRRLLYLKIKLGSKENLVRHFTSFPKDNVAPKLDQFFFFR
jgi:hypothetical protein